MKLLVKNMLTEKESYKKMRPNKCLRGKKEMSHELKAGFGSPEPTMENENEPQLSSDFHMLVMA